MPVPSFIPGGSIVSLTPPLPAPGHKIPTSIAFIQVVGRPLDILFFQNWPDQINEGLTSAWAQFNFSPATAPLAFQYEGTQWDPIVVNLVFHSGNNGSLFGIDTRLTGTDDFSRNIANPVLDLLRIQLQVAWCKSLALPSTDAINAPARKLYKALAKGKGFFAGLQAAAESVAATGELLAKQGSKIFPPMCRIAYGGFLLQFGYCASVQIRYLPPFTPVSAHPHRAEVDLTFHRAFPIGSMPSGAGVRRRALLGMA
ncbi:hypothetical protein LCGC14_0332240 [marine sediment metagenome]|uniref:Uncharacterized protein n=1 Tax=marine sediment metagenome TaxID=412755 RepID=A0A0F9TG57_9ZZZZ